MFLNQIDKKNLLKLLLNFSVLLKSLVMFLKQQCSGMVFMALMVSFWWVGVDTLPFWKDALSGILFTKNGLLFLVSGGTCLVLWHTSLLLIMSSFLPAKVLKVLVVFLSVVGGAGLAFSSLYGTLMTPEMIRNVLETDYQETKDLLSLTLMVILFLGALPPIILVWRYKSEHISVTGRIKRLGVAIACLVIGGVFLLTDYNGWAFYMREHHEARYLITPSNIVASFTRIISREGKTRTDGKRIVVDPNPVLSEDIIKGKPLLIAVVIGETTRATSWGLSGYSRDTNLFLRKTDIFNFSDVTSCGTSTAVSLPCMFSRIGLSNYDRELILSEEFLPDVINRLPVNQVWIDNQSGSKGVSQNIKTLVAEDLLSDREKANLCRNGNCYDEVFPAILNSHDFVSEGENIVYLHMIGSHGPAYHLRYPETFEKWGPTCKSKDLRSCDPKELRNAYDNSVSYTDKVLADIINRLSGMTNVDTALIYVSDHGESLGENGFYLHGAPELFSPDEQKKVPMVMWFSEGFKSRFKLDTVCLENKTNFSWSHDNLWSTLLGLFRIKSQIYEQDKDILQGCMEDF